MRRQLARQYLVLKIDASLLTLSERDIPKKGMVQARKPVKQTYRLLYTSLVGKPLGIRCFTSEHSIMSRTGMV